MDQEYETLKRMIDKKPNNIERNNIVNGALKDYEEVMKGHNVGLADFEKKYLATLSEDVSFEVHEKEISQEKYNKIQKVVAAIIGVAITGGLITIAIDIVLHPENYLTTNPDFIGPNSTFSMHYEQLSNLIGGIRK